MSENGKDALDRFGNDLIGARILINIHVREVTRFQTNDEPRRIERFERRVSADCRTALSVRCSVNSDWTSEWPSPMYFSVNEQHHRNTHRMIWSVHTDLHSDRTKCDGLAKAIQVNFDMNVLSRVDPRCSIPVRTRHWSSILCGRARMRST